MLYCAHIPSMCNTFRVCFPSICLVTRYKSAAIWFVFRFSAFCRRSAYTRNVFSKSFADIVVFRPCRKRVAVCAVRVSIAVCVENQKTRQQNCCRDKIEILRCHPALARHRCRTHSTTAITVRLLTRAYVLGYSISFASALRGPYYRVRFLPASHRRRLSLSPSPVFFPSTV